MALVLAVVIAVSFTIVAAAVLILARLVDTGSLGRNSAFGIRTSSTKRNDQAWKAGHRAAQPLTRALGITLLVLAVAVIGLGITGSTAAVAAASVVGYLIVFVMLGMVVRRANAAARAAD
ncbi:SdpI family protein [Krasilnikovia sp. MM14-A1004]|uniref:SdpI family protein n=1 Tax=Krasilnikovia sp. MM14-A1004 TaxID=3373541 RepID=UPI00399CF9CF